MTNTAITPEAYLQALPPERQQAVTALRNAVRGSLPEGFAETMQYGMITYVVPHSLHPKGYRANPADPLPFIGIASQKQYVSLYHMGLNAMPDELAWFSRRYAALGIGKLDMGKACIRFRNPGKIPLPLISELCGRVTPQQYIAAVEQSD